MLQPRGEGSLWCYSYTAVHRVVQNLCNNTVFDQFFPHELSASHNGRHQGLQCCEDSANPIVPLESTVDQRNEHYTCIISSNHHHSSTLIINNLVIILSDNQNRISEPYTIQYHGEMSFRTSSAALYSSLSLRASSCTTINMNNIVLSVIVLKTKFHKKQKLSVTVFSEKRAKAL